jgi:hypothetical protein
MSCENVISPAFPSSWCAYAGLDVTVYSSAGKRCSGHLSRQGRGETPKGQQSFISCTAPSSEAHLSRLRHTWRQGPRCGRERKEHGRRNQRGVEFVKEQLRFTGEDSPMATLLLSVMGAFAEFERALIRERQLEGIAQAKQRGAYKGRKKSLAKDEALALIDRAAAGEAKTLLAKEFGVSRETVYAYLRAADTP